MDWELVVKGNAERLQRVLATLIAMAGLPVGSGGQFTFFPQEGALPQDKAPAEKSKLSPARTLSRRLHRAILRLLRPLESATRRLIIVAARDLPVPVLPPPRPRKPKPDLKTAHAALRRLGIAVVLSSADIARAAAEKRAAQMRDAARAARADRTPPFPLADPLKRFGPRRRYVPPHAAPRILSFDGAIPHKLPPPPGPHDPIDATRLSLRLAGISRALSDLPGQARRYVRWKARSDARRMARGLVPRSPLRPGRAPGWRQRSKDEINEVLADLQYFAREVLRAPDTS